MRRRPLVQRWLCRRWDSPRGDFNNDGIGLIWWPAATTVRRSISCWVMASQLLSADPPLAAGLPHGAAGRGNISDGSDVD